MPKTAEWLAYSVGHDPTPRSAASDLGLHCLLKPVCLFKSVKGTYGRFEFL